MTRIIVGVLRLYQGISRSLGAYSLLFFVSTGCRSWPTCSDYTIQAVREDGPVRGLARGMIRVARCNPLFSPQTHR